MTAPYTIYVLNKVLEIHVPFFLCFIVVWQSLKRGLLVLFKLLLCSIMCIYSFVDVSLLMAKEVIFPFLKAITETNFPTFLKSDHCKKDLRTHSLMQPWSILQVSPLLHVLMCSNEKWLTKFVSACIMRSSAFFGKVKIALPEIVFVLTETFFGCWNWAEITVFSSRPTADYPNTPDTEKWALETNGAKPPGYSFHPMAKLFEFCYSKKLQQCISRLTADS